MNDSTTVRCRAKRIRAIVTGIILGGMLTAGFVLLVGVLLFRERVPALTKADYQAAVERWQTKRPKDYNCDIEVYGNRPGAIHVEVRAGEVVRMTRDGVEPRQRRTWDYWSVDGQLETIGEELAMAADPEHAFGGGATAPPILSARFHPELGYPEIYRRIVPGTQQDVTWKITRFEPFRHPSP
jgi:hypothetical protein